VTTLGAFGGGLATSNWTRGWPRPLPSVIVDIQGQHPIALGMVAPPIGVVLATLDGFGGGQSGRTTYWGGQPPTKFFLLMGGKTGWRVGFGSTCLTRQPVKAKHEHDPFNKRVDTTRPVLTRLVDGS
jgi:hypothetical protein